MVAETGDSAELRDWVACLVCPLTEHLAQLGNPTWYARFAAQALTDPAYHKIVIKDALASPSLVQVVDGITRCLPDLPMAVVTERNIMARNLMMHTCADFERAFAEGADVPRTSWSAVGSGLIDAIVGTVAGAGHGAPADVKVTVDQDKCASSGQCVLNAGELFDQRDDDGVVVLLDDSPPPEQAENARKAAAACPALAIDIEE